MARTIQEIKRTMTDAFMANETIREMYHIDAGKTFGETFSPVSLESILFYIVAACHYVMESLFERHTQEVEETISRAVVASVPWYYEMARAFQYGDSLFYDEKTKSFRYTVNHPSKQLVRYVAVRDTGTSIQILVSGEENGMPVPLSNAVQTAFKHYMNRVKIAGVVLRIRSLPADEILLNIQVQVDPLLIDTSGVKIATGEHAVEDAIKAYLAGITFGGTFNKTKLVDAIQAVDGVVDVILGGCRYKASTDADYKTIQGNNYTAVGGSFRAVGLSNSIQYVV